MSTPTDADRVTLHIAGHVHADCLKYSIDSDFFTPADGWSVSLGTPAAALPEYLQPWAEVQIRIGDELVMSGRVDRVRHAFRKGEHILDIRGRDGAAVLLDCSAPIFVSREVTLSEAVAAVARPLGIAKLDIAGRDAAFVKVTIEPGMSAWESSSRPPKQAACGRGSPGRDPQDRGPGLYRAARRGPDHAAGRQRATT